MRQWILVLLAVALIAGACSDAPPAVLSLATTTSTNDSGLLDAIVPDFEEQYNASVQVVAVGTGQAIALGEAGDADVILVHSRSREDAFVEEGHGTARYDVMYNDFIIVGPTEDPAAIVGTPTASDGMAVIAATESTFASRGDDSGTHSKELSLWKAAGIEPDPNAVWYKSLGQGMGATLNFANESGAYTLTDRGTYLSQSDALTALGVVVGGASIDENVDPALLNPYGVILVTPDKGNINAELASEFVKWITSVEVQEQISVYGVDAYGQPLFYPDSEAWSTR